MIFIQQKVPFIYRGHRLTQEKILWIFFVLIIVAALLILFGNLGVEPLWGSEGRWAMICRHMYRSGEIFRPLLGTSLYWDKPLLSYWLVLPLAYINGGVTEAVIRTPSVISAILLLILTFDLAKTWFGNRTGLLSMAVLITSYGFVFWARNGQVEMLNAFVILLSIWYFLKHRSDESREWLYILGVIMALGANLKGLPVYGVTIFSIILLCIVKKECPPSLTCRHCAAAMTLSIAAYVALPLVAVYFTGTLDPIKMIWQENILRFFTPFDHKGPIWTYFIRIFDMTAPWSFLLPAALIHLFLKFREGKSNAMELFTLLGGVFIFFTLSGSRRPYYLLPIIPFISILTAHFLVEFSKRLLPRFLDRFVTVFGLIIGVVLIAPIFILAFYSGVLPFESKEIANKELWTVAILMALVSTSMIAFSAKRRVRGMAVSMIAVWLVYIFGIIPLYSKLPNVRTEVMDVKALCKPCAFLYKTNDRVVFYLDQPCKVFSGEATAYYRAAKSGVNELYQFFAEIEARSYDWAVKSDGILIVEDYLLDKKRWQLVYKSRTWNAMVPSSS